MEQKNIIGIFVIILAGSILGTWAVTQFIFNAGATPIRISGAGATFPQPLYQKWTEEFNTLTGIQVDYEGIGSGGGINQHTAKTIDFGATDPPMTDEEWVLAQNTLQIPATIGGVIVIFNLPTISELNLTGDVTAKIFATNITQWDDSAITSLQNPTVAAALAALPTKDIEVVHRSDSSGTTKVFTSFLSDESPAWNITLGASKTINWNPSTTGQKGNSGVSGYVVGNEYTIGYTELSYVVTNNIDNAAMQNANGTYSKASTTTIAQAATAISSNLPAGSESWASVGAYFKINGSTCGDSYPISSFSYLLVYKELNVISGMTLAKAKALTNFLWFGIHTGQYYANALHYVAIPDAVVEIDVASLRSITFNGEVVNTWA